MAAFNLDFSAVLNSDTGRALVLTDLSNYITNDEGYTTASFSSRVYVIRNYKGETIATLPIGSEPIVVVIDKDKWLEITMVFTLLDNSTIELLVKKPCGRIVELELIKRSTEVCGHGCSSGDKSNLRLATNAIYAADNFALKGDGVNYQEQIDIANKFVKAKC